MRFFLQCLPVAVSLSAAIAQEPAKPKPDSRVDSRLTCSVNAAKLEDVAKELTSLTSVSVRAGVGERDWKSRERRISVRFVDRPLKSVLDQISGTLNFALSRVETSTLPEYRIWQDMKGREFEKAMLASQKDQPEREIRAIRERMIREFEGVLAMSKADAAKLKDEAPWRAYLGGTEGGRAFAKMMTSLPDVAKELMLRGKKVTLRLSDLPGPAQQAVTAFTKDNLWMKIEPGAAEQAGRIQPTRVVIEPLRTSGREDSATGAFGFVGMISIRGSSAAETLSGMQRLHGESVAEMPLIGGDSGFGRLLGKAAWRLEAGEKFSDIEQELEGEMMPLFSEMMLKKFQPTPTPTDPPLLQEIEPLQLQDADTNDPTPKLLDELATKTKLSIVLEYFPAPNPLPFGIAMPTKKEKLYKVLDALRGYGFEWEYRDETIRLRPVDWAVQRSYDIAESTLAKYRSILKRQGWLKLENVSAIALELTDGQILNRLVHDKELESATTVFRYGEFEDQLLDLLRFYGTLSAVQRERLEGENGLPLDMVTDAQWTYLQDLVEEESAIGEGAAMALRLTGHTDYGSDPTAGKPPKPRTEKDVWYVRHSFAFVFPPDADGKSREVTRSIHISGPAALNQRALMDDEAKPESAAQKADPR